MELTSFPSVDALAAAVVDILKGVLRVNPRAVFGWPSGRTTLPVLRAVAQSPGFDARAATIAMMDDYVLDGPGGHVAVDPTAHYSCANWVSRHLLPAFPAGQAPRIIHPDVDAPAAYDRQLLDLGGVDVFLAGVGSSDGHVAFNPPGTPLERRTRIIALADSTRRDNLGTFPAFTSLDDVPAAGLTVGLDTIRDARRVIALAHGAGKADVVRRTLAAGSFDPQLPSTFLFAHPCSDLFVADLGVDL